MIDALGYVPPDGSADNGGPSHRPALDRRQDFGPPIVNPFESIDRLPDDHPYRLVGVDALREGLALFDDVTGEQYRGSHTDRNALVPTYGGTPKPTARYPAGAAAGLASDTRPMLVVGVRKLTAFDGRLVADGLAAIDPPFEVAGVDIPFAEGLPDDAVITRYAKALEKNERIDGTPARQRLVDLVKPHLMAVSGGAERVGFPAFLGRDSPAEVRADLASRLGADVFELPMGPPSVPGLRLEDRLTGALEEAGVNFEFGNPVVGYETAESGRVENVLVDRKGQRVPYGATEFVLGTGGLVGKGIDSNRKQIEEPVFDCHVPAPADRYEWFVEEAFGDQPYARFGVMADERLRPLDAGEHVQYEKVRVVGATLGWADVAREKSASGVSLATGVTAGRLAAEERRT